MVFEFARPARDEHHASRVEHHEYKLKNEHELEHSAAADRDMNSSSVGHHSLQVEAEAKATTHTRWRRAGLDVREVPRVGVRDLAHTTRWQLFASATK